MDTQNGEVLLVGKEFYKELNKMNDLENKELGLMFNMFASNNKFKNNLERYDYDRPKPRKVITAKQKTVKRKKRKSAKKSRRNNRKK